MVMLVQRFWREERGQELIEYALLAATVAVAAVAALPSLAPPISKLFSMAVSALAKFS